MKRKVYKLVGFKTNPKKLVCGNPECETELESQAQQLFDFIYCQIPARVMEKLSVKLDKYYDEKGIKRNF